MKPFFVREVFKEDRPYYPNFTLADAAAPSAKVQLENLLCLAKGTQTLEESPPVPHPNVRFNEKLRRAVYSSELPRVRPQGVFVGLITPKGKGKRGASTSAGSIYWQGTHTRSEH